MFWREGSALRILVSTLGKGKYEETVYLLPDGSEVKSKLVTKALMEYIKPTSIYIIGTPQSMWELANELVKNYSKVIIPFGKSKEEFWEMFRVIHEQIDVEEKEVYLDITHGFRAIPLLVSTVINLFTKVKRAEVKGLFYGINEAKDEKNRAPVVDLLPIIELNTWIEAFILFKNYGEGDSLAELIDRKLKGLQHKKTETHSNLGKIPKLLRKYSQAVGFTAVDFIPSFVEQVSEMILSIDKVPEELYAVELLKEAFGEVRNAFKGFLEEDKKECGNQQWRNQLQTVKWLFEKRRYSQAIIALEECIFTYVLENIGIDIYDKKRERLGAAFREDEKTNKFFKKELNALFSKIRDLRNKTGHAFMQKNVSESVIKNAINNLKEYIDETEKILRKECIKDKESLIEFIS